MQKALQASSGQSRGGACLVQELLFSLISRRRGIVRLHDRISLAVNLVLNLQSLLMEDSLSSCAGCVWSMLMLPQPEGCSCLKG